MTPEESIAAALSVLDLPCGHWPYTERLEGLAIGYRPREDDFSPSASGRALRVRVSYDLVVVRTRDAQAEQAERTRFALYQALRTAGWTITGMGPETYVAEQRRHYWPVTASRNFRLTAQGQPEDMTNKKGDKADEQ